MADDRDEGSDQVIRRSVGTLAGHRDPNHRIAAVEERDGLLLGRLSWSGTDAVAMRFTDHEPVTVLTYPPRKTRPPASRSDTGCRRSMPAKSPPGAGRNRGPIPEHQIAQSPDQQVAAVSDVEEERKWGQLVVAEDR